MDDITQVMRGNIEKIRDREEKLEPLVEQAERLEDMVSATCFGI
jgi:hypothetical protein